MTTNIDIDENLLEQARSLGHHRTKKSAVNEALAEYVCTRKQRRVMELFGTIEFDPDYDYKAERRSR
jgi:Arc/MetJ family transcription regulator